MTVRIGTQAGKPKEMSDVIIDFAPPLKKCTTLPAWMSPPTAPQHLPYPFPPLFLPPLASALASLDFV